MPIRLATMQSRASSQTCIECWRCLQLQQRRAASSSSFTQRRGNETTRYSREVVGQLPSSLRKDWRQGTPSTSAAPSRQSSPLRERPPFVRKEQSVSGSGSGSSNGGGSNNFRARQPPAKPAASEFAVNSKAPKNVNFAHGSALAAFLNKNAAAAAQAGPTKSTAAPARSPQTQHGKQTTARPTLGQAKGRAARKPARPTRQIQISSVTSVATLAKLMNLKLGRLQHLMERMGMTDTRPDRLLGSEDASLVAVELGFDAILDKEASFDIYPAPPPANSASLPLRPPIVTIMGHVDHGKTSLLDALRSTRVAAGEAGGITQHIGAFSVPLSSLLSSNPADVKDSTVTDVGSITFLDTPGHAAFTAMRSRGASVTDVVVLVVAADDGVKPQTEEVIKLVKNEDVGLVIAITKCDKAGIDVSRVHTELLQRGLEVEQLGGDIPCVEVSAHTKTGLPDLVETINAVAEVRDLRAEKEGVPSEGFVIESRKETGRGNVATVIVTRGTLRTGATILAGKSFARVRVLASSDGRTLQEAGPGTPVEVTGWKELPEAGDQVLEAKDEDAAKEAVETRRRRAERQRTMGDLDIINEKRRIEAEAATLAKQMAEDAKAQGGEGSKEDFLKSLRSSTESGVKELRLIIKADFSGTVEAVSNALAEIGNSEAKVKVIETGVGDVTDGDLAMAKAVDGMVVGFNIKASRPMMSTASALGVSILVNDVIYRLIEDVKERVIDLLPRLFDTRVLGEATVQQVFAYNLKGAGQRKIAGCRVTNGVLQKKAKIRLLRDREVVYEGDVESLKHLKADVDEARKGSECGLNLVGCETFQEGDTLQSYELIPKVRVL